MGLSRESVSCGPTYFSLAPNTTTTSTNSSSTSRCAPPCWSDSGSSPATCCHSALLGCQAATTAFASPASAPVRARDVMTTMATLGQEVTADLFDLDQSALDEGKLLQPKWNLTDRVGFFHHDLTKPSRQAVRYWCACWDRMSTDRQNGHSRLEGRREKPQTWRNPPLSARPLKRWRWEIRSVASRLYFQPTGSCSSGTKWDGNIVRSAGLEVVELTAEPSGFNRLVLAGNPPN